MCMEINGVSRETGFPGKLQLTENKKESILALAARLSLPYDVYDGKAVKCERGGPAPLDGLAVSSLSGGYILLMSERFWTEGGRLGAGPSPRCRFFNIRLGWISSTIERQVSCGD